MMTMICMNCGKELIGGAVTFCPYCGTRIAAAAEASVNEAHAAETVTAPDVDNAAPAPVPAAEPTFTAPEIPEPTAPAMPRMPDVPPIPTVQPVYPAAGMNTAQPAANAQYMQTQAVYKAPPAVQKPKKAPKKKEKEFFGVGALIFCLIVIALLAGAAGMFAYLYFAQLGVL